MVVVALGGVKIASSPEREQLGKETLIFLPLTIDNRKCLSLAPGNRLRNIT